MAIIDIKDMFTYHETNNADGIQAVTVSAASVRSLRFKRGLDEMNNAVGQEPAFHAGQKLIVQLTETFLTLTSLTVTLQDSADDSTFADTEITKTVTLASGNLVAGKVLLNTTLPVGLREYCRIYMAVAGSAATAGKYRAWIGQVPIRWKNYSI